MLKNLLLTALLTTAFGVSSQSNTFAALPLYADSEPEPYIPEPDDDYEPDFLLNDIKNVALYVHGTYLNSQSGDMQWLGSHYMPSVYSCYENHFTRLNDNLQTLYAGGVTTENLIQAMSANYTQFTNRGTLGAVSYTFDGTAYQFTAGVTSNNKDESIWTIDTNSDGTKSASILYNRAQSYFGNYTNLPSSTNNTAGESCYGYSDVESTTLARDYGQNPFLYQDKFGLFFGASVMSQLRSSNYAFVHYTLDMTFGTTGFVINDYNPLTFDNCNADVWFLIKNKLSNQLEWVNNDLLATLNRTRQSSACFPGGTMEAYSSMYYDGGCYKMVDPDSYDGAVCYEVQVIFNQVPRYLVYNSYLAYCMAQYAGFVGGYNLSTNTGAGYAQGFADGFTAGSSGAGGNTPDNPLTGPFALIGSAFYSISSILNIPLFAGITLGTLLFLPLVILIVIAIVKLIKG